MANIVMAVKGTGGDLFPFSRIGTLLRQRGHEVVVIHDIEQPFSHRFQEEMVKLFGLNYVAIQPEPASQPGIEQIPSIRGESRVPRTSLADTKDYDPAAELFEFNTIVPYCRSDESVLVVHKNLHLVTEAVSEKLEIPLVMVQPGPFYLTSMPILADIYRMRADSVNRFRRAIGLPPATDWLGLLWSSDITVGLWPEWYAPVEPHWPPISLVGFLSDYGEEPTSIPRKVEEFLTSGEPPVLVSHGTTPPDRPGFFTSSAEACHQLGHRALILTRYEELLPHNLPDGVEWFSYVPLRRLMKRFRAIIHHGGIGTTAQALAAGIPQLVLGFNYDRPDNGTRLEALGVGRFLSASQWTRQAIADSLRHLLESSSISQRCKVLSGQSDYPDAALHACEVIENISMNRHSSKLASKKHLANNAEPPIVEESWTGGQPSAHAALSGLSNERRALLAMKLRTRKGTS